MGVVQEAVEDRRRQHVVAEDRAPLRHDLVRGDQETAALVAPRDQLEEEMGGALLKRQVPELVDDEELGLREVRELRVELPLRLGASERREQRRSADEEHSVAGLHGGAPEGDREVGLPTPGGPKMRTFSALAM